MKLVEQKNSAVAYWEGRRIAYNLLLIPPALLGYLPLASLSGAVEDRARFGIFGTIVLFLTCAGLANVCFSFAYALEFFLLYEADPGPRPKRLRTFAFVLGSAFACMLSFSGGRNIAVLQYAAAP